MTILGRHIFIELLKVFTVTLTAMTVLMVLVGIVQEAIRESLTPETILKLIPYVLPNALCFAIPGTMLFSVCLIYGRMSAGNEVVAIKSAGLSPLKVMLPALILATLLSFLTLFLNDLAVSWGRSGIYRVVLHSVEKTIYAGLKAEKMYAKGNILIKVSDVDQDRLLEPIVQIRDQNQFLRFEAEQAKLLVDADNEELIFEVQGAVAENRESGAIVRLASGRLPVPLRDATKRSLEQANPSNVPLRSIARESRRELSQLKRTQALLAMGTALGLTAGDYVDVTSRNWPARYEIVNDSKNRIHRLRTEPWRRWANGFSCLCFVLVGAPLAIHFRRADVWTTFGICFIPILLAYYPLLMLGVAQAKSGTLPAPIVWLGNTVMIVVGLYLIRETIRK